MDKDEREAFMQRIYANGVKDGVAITCVCCWGVAAVFVIIAVVFAI